MTRCTCWGCQKSSAKRRIVRERQADKDFKQELKEIYEDSCSSCKLGKLILICNPEYYVGNWYECDTCGSAYCL